MNISVIVPTYNRPKALKLCLLSLSRQSVLPAEVLIADDGSGRRLSEPLKYNKENLLNSWFMVHGSTLLKPGTR